ncbi:hypothetical protein V6N13_114874 [Hibiscus sabdariffa]
MDETMWRWRGRTARFAGGVVTPTAEETGLHSRIWFPFYIIASFLRISSQFAFAVKRDSLLRFPCLIENEPFLSRQSLFSLMVKPNVFQHHNILCKLLHARYLNNASIELQTDEDVIQFSFNKPLVRSVSSNRKKKMSKRARMNELRFYRLKAKRKMNSPNPEVRIRYKLEKAPAKADDPEILTEGEKHYLKRTGEKKKSYVQVGRRGVFGGVVLNMHLHWKKHETVKALERYKYKQSLDHTSEFIEKLEKELEEYLAVQESKRE